MGGEEHDAGVEGPAELGHRGYTFLNDPTPGSAAEFAQEEGSLRLGKPIADDVARVGDPGSYRLVDNVDVLEVGSPGRSAHGGRGAQVTRMIQSDSASLTFRKQDRPLRVQLECGPRRGVGAADRSPVRGASNEFLDRVHGSRTVHASQHAPVASAKPKGRFGPWPGLGRPSRRLPATIGGSLAGAPRAAGGRTLEQCAVSRCAGRS